MVNQAFIIGNLGSSPKISATQTGKLVANFSVATSEAYTDHQGQKQKRTEWHHVVAFNRQAEIAELYLQKGSLVCIIGQLRTRQWQDRNGTTCYTTEIAVKELRMLDKKQGAVTFTAPAPAQSTDTGSWDSPITENSVPF
jgi:single-strand DNA-binding protein